VSCEDHGLENNPFITISISGFECSFNLQKHFKAIYTEVMRVIIDQQQYDLQIKFNGVLY
jgi:hypothetical protein